MGYWGVAFLGRGEPLQIQKMLERFAVGKKTRTGCYGMRLKGDGRLRRGRLMARVMVV